MTRSLALVLALAAVAGSALLACSEPGTQRAERAAGTERSATEVPDPSGRAMAADLGEPLMIALAQARNHHHKADVYLSEGNIDQAIEAMRQVLSLAFPEGAAEAEDVKLDARARLAKLLNAQGKTSEAMAVVDEGIAAATRRSFFLANLYTVRGEVFEAMATMLDDQDTDTARAEARESRKRAIEAFDQSIAINAELQSALMREGAR